MTETPTTATEIGPENMPENIPAPVDTRLDEELTGDELAARYPDRRATTATPTATAYLVYAAARDAQPDAHAAYVLDPRDRDADRAYTAAVQARETARDAYVLALKNQIEAAQ